MKKISYDISEVVPYINWLYFYHAWGLSGKKEEEKQKMRQEAEEMLSSWEGKYHTHALLKVLDAYSEGDPKNLLLKRITYSPITQLSCGGCGLT